MGKWSTKFNENFIKNYNENSDVGYFLEVDIEYPKQLWSSHKDLPFLPWRKKVENLVCSIEDKEKYVIHIRALKQALNHGLILKGAIILKHSMHNRIINLIRKYG